MKPLQATHLLKLPDKMCKYEMDLKSIVEDTERTRFCPQTDRRTNKVKPVYPPFNLVEAGVLQIKPWVHRTKTDTSKCLKHNQCFKLNLSLSRPEMLRKFLPLYNLPSSL